MSRIGRLPIAIPQGVTVSINNGTLTTTGPKGSLARSLHPDIPVIVEGNRITIQRSSDAKEHRALHGLTRALIANMVQGVHQGFEKVLELRGVGYRAEVSAGGSHGQPQKLILQVGYSHPVEFAVPEGISVEVTSSTPNAENGYLAARITLRGIDKQLLGDFAANVRHVRPVEPYKGKGLRYAGETVHRKLGKAGKAGEGRK